eukprot:SAG11_NODE_2350_length_3483_cov_3.342494_1_plen_174_part_00
MMNVMLGAHCAQLLLAATSVPAYQCGNMTILAGFGLMTDAAAKNLTKGVASHAACCALCLADAGRCTAYTYHPAGQHSALSCYLMHASGPIAPHPSIGAISGSTLPAPAPAPPAPPLPPPPPTPKGAKNVLVLIADDFRPAANHSYGMTEVSTPNIDQLSQSGLTFTNAYSQV